jgi:hypothetical protein
MWVAPVFILASHWAWVFQWLLPTPGGDACCGWQMSRAIVCITFPCGLCFTECQLGYKSSQRKYKKPNSFFIWLKCYNWNW